MGLWDSGCPAAPSSGAGSPAPAGTSNLGYGSALPAWSLHHMVPAPSVSDPSSSLCHVLRPPLRLLPQVHVPLMDAGGAIRL